MDPTSRDEVVLACATHDRCAPGGHGATCSPFVHVEPWLVQLFFADEGARLDESERHRALAGDLLWRARGIRTERTS
jgi:hypothetical protein